MTSEAEIIAKARAFLAAQEDAELAASPLGAMSEWVESGAPPPCATLRALGFAADSGREQLRLARPAFLRRWGWSIPCAEAIAALRQLAPIVEIGAGGGCLTAILRAAGHDAIATDLKSEGTVSYRSTIGACAEVETLGAVQAVKRYPERDVLCAWPEHNEAWSCEAAEAIAAGRRFALIGKPRGGDTGSDALFDLLEARFTVEADVEIPQFPNERDQLVIYRRSS